MCHECKQPMHADPASVGRRRKAESVKCRNPECRKNKKVDPDEVRRLIQDKLAEKRRKK